MRPTGADAAIAWAALAAPAPWLAPFGVARQRVIAARRPGDALADTLNRAAGAACPVRFVPQARLPHGEPYEAFIARTGCVPTRDSLHDLFNALAWMTFPAIKRRLNAMQAAQIARHGVGPVRGAARDALTLLDENGALWSPPPALRAALRARDWHALFVVHRAAWDEAPRPILFGHALLEKLARPRKAITAHVWLPSQSCDEKPFAPLPVLGVPGWWAPNEAPGFYADRTVFRMPSGIIAP